MPLSASTPIVITSSRFNRRPMRDSPLEFHGTTPAGSARIWVSSYVRGRPSGDTRLGLDALRRNLEACELEARRDRAADQAVGAEAARALPGAGGHDALGSLPGREVHPQDLVAHAAPGARDGEEERPTGVEVPDLRGVYEGIPCGPEWKGPGHAGQCIARSRGSTGRCGSLSRNRPDHRRLRPETGGDVRFEIGAAASSPLRSKHPR